MRFGTITRLALAATVALATVTATTATSASAAPKAATSTVAKAAGTLTSTVDGTFGDGGTVAGTFTPSTFAVQHGVLVAEGTLHSVLTDASGNNVGTTDSNVTLPVQTSSSTGTGAAKSDAATPLVACNILHLVLGPLDLNLLGLAVHLNTVVLDITANSGPGNLLGNLLCAVAGLLDGGTLPLGSLSALLNAILAALGL